MDCESRAYIWSGFFYILNMSESIQITGTTKKEQYESLLPQLEALWMGETDALANMANTCAALFQVFQHHWIGFYLVKNDELVLGPFQGPVACTRIAFGKGVCGNSWAEKKTLIVPNVNEFPGHIACSALSQSEIVVPVFKNEIGNKTVVGVLDIDSIHLNQFDSEDAIMLEKIIEKLIQASQWP